MTEQNTKIDGRTRRAADLALAKRTISRASYDAVLAGQIDLATAKAIGRNGTPAIDASPGRSGQDDATERARSSSADDSADTPPQPTSRVSKSERSRLCMCGCENRTRGGRFMPGHDVRLVTYAKEYIRGERELTEEQLEYVTTSGKLQRARKQVEREEQKRQQRAES